MRSRKTEKKERSAVVQAEGLAQGAVERDRIREELAHCALAIFKWQWLDDEFTNEAQRALPPLLLQLYVDMTSGRKPRISMRQASELMGVDYARTGPRYIAQAEARGLIATQRTAADKRKILISGTRGLKELLDRELAVFAASVPSPARNAWQFEAALRQIDHLQRLLAEEERAGWKRLSAAKKSEFRRKFDKSVWEKMSVESVWEKMSEEEIESDLARIWAQEERLERESGA